MDNLKKLLNRRGIVFFIELGKSDEEKLLFIDFDGDIVIILIVNILSDQGVVFIQIRGKVLRTFCMLLHIFCSVPYDRCVSHILPHICDKLLRRYQEIYQQVLNFSAKN
jgi:hypothetical protein